MQLKSTLITEIISTSGKKPTFFTEKQKQVLMKWFEAKPYLELGEKHQLAELLNISDEKISRWFRGALFRKRRKNISCKYMRNPE